MKQHGEPAERIIALAGNPNVGKSTVFNRLTGGRQHTGNWAGKTVATARGSCQSAANRYALVDLPGTYSLSARSAEEELARDYICFGEAEAVLVVCDATCLERGVNLLLQILEVTPRVLLCVNLMDEAQRKGIRLDLPLLQQRLGIPVTGISARERGSRARLLAALDSMVDGEPSAPRSPRYSEPLEQALERIRPMAETVAAGRLSGRWLSLRLLEGDRALLERVDTFLGGDLSSAAILLQSAAGIREKLAEQGLNGDALADSISASLVRESEELCRGVIREKGPAYSSRDRRIDRWVTSRALGYPLMLALLAVVFYLTIKGANGLSDWLAAGLFAVQKLLDRAAQALELPAWLQGMLIDGAWRVLAWVVSVMLPPMAIFFPLFTLLEDLGYLPRVAYNLDRPFHRCGSCGKQALTMCMGFGCNAAGVVGCRIIDSERERLLAMLTNSLVPCNGRFPILLAILSMFFAGAAGGGAWLPALLLTGVILLGVVLSLLTTRLLACTILKGKASSFVLELPPYRRPQLGQILLRSLLDRTLFVLGRAAAVAAPAGALIWLLANTHVNGESPLQLCAGALDPLGRFLGMDGGILIAFVLGLPANETVLPMILMIYTAQGSLQELGTLQEVHSLLLQNGWTPVTAVCVLLFTLLHWPCSTTLLSIRREAGGWKWAGLAALLPTGLGILLCALIANAARLLGA